jgi:hypothetical protein
VSAATATNAMGNEVSFAGYSCQVISAKKFNYARINLLHCLYGLKGMLQHIALKRNYQTRCYALLQL